MDDVASYSLLSEVLTTHILVNLCSDIPESVISRFLADVWLKATWNSTRGREGISPVKLCLPLEFRV